MKINVLGNTVELTVEEFLKRTFDVKEEDAAKKIKVQEIQMKNTQAEFLLKTKKLFEVDKEITDKILTNNCCKSTSISRLELNYVRLAIYSK